MRQHFRVRYVAANKATAILDWEFDIDWTNACYDDAVSSWTTEAANIAYPLKNTYSASDRTTGTSVASVPSWSETNANCRQIWNLEIFNEATQEYVTTGMNDTS